MLGFALPQYEIKGDYQDAFLMEGAAPCVAVVDSSLNVSKESVSRDVSRVA